MRFLASVCCLIVLSVHVLVARAEGPAAELPALDVLQHYVGNWDVKVTSAEPPLTGEVTAKWVLDGRFVEQQGALHTPDGKQVVQLKTLFTYDPQAKVYRSWTFTSNSAPVEAEAKWDPASKTMESLGKPSPDGTRVRTRADFSQQDVETWTIEVLDQAGKTVGEVRGENRRKSGGG